MPAYDASIAITSPKRVLDLTAPDGEYIIACHDLESFRFEGYLKAFDPEFFEGRGGVDLTGSTAEALRFKSIEEVLTVWKMQSETRPTREDGKPNRPLTAYTISPEKLA